MREPLNDSRTAEDVFDDTSVDGMLRRGKETAAVSEMLYIPYHCLVLAVVALIHQLAAVS